MSPTFRSLRIPNYRLWASGAIVSNTGTWMQRVAQDWLVLTVLTANSGTAVGITTGLQFAPALPPSARPAAAATPGWPAASPGSTPTSAPPSQQPPRS